MAIIVEDGTGTNPAANSYVSEAELTTYASDRGITLTGSTDVLLVQAMDYIEVQSFKGTKTSEDQPLEWPRTGAYLDGYLIPSDSIPQTLKALQMRLAMDIDAGTDPNGVSDQAVKQETVFGAVSVTYQDGSSVSSISKQVRSLLGKLTNGGGMFQFGVSRG